MPYRFTRRVEFGDTDMAGIMHFSNFFRFMEAAETDFLRNRGLSVSWSEGGVKYGFPRVGVKCDFKSPAKFEDLIDIDVTLESIGTKSLTYRFDFRRGETLLAVGAMTSVFVASHDGVTMTARELPSDLRAKLTA
jgi:YbgC/YbaW family acyl-CoA thioester hydrolase